MNTLMQVVGGSWRSGTTRLSSGRTI